VGGSATLTALVESTEYNTTENCTHNVEEEEEERKKK
jgi:hypothetical protein